MKNNYLQMKWAVRAALLALLLSAMGMMNAKAEEYFTVNNLNFVIDENGDVTLLGHVLGQDAYGELLIPDSVEYWGYEWPVIAIADHAFEESGIDGHLVIPNTVVSIGDYAFAYCGGLKDVLVLGNAVTSIGISAFEGCDSFTCQLVLPDHLITIGDYAFSGCNGFTGSISIPNTVTTIGAFAFAMCTFSGDLILPNSVTSIGVGAFYDDIFSGTLTLSSNLMVIPDEAFAGCSGFMGNLVIPGSVVEIGEYAFAGCSGFTGELVLSNVLHVIGDDAFTGCSGFTGDLVIPNSVNTMGEKAFDGCSGFNGSLSIPNYVSQIAYKTFNGCSGFTGDLVIPNEVTDINDYAFAGCSGFNGALSLPYYLTAVGEQAFANCNDLSSIISQAEEPPMLNATAFVDVDIDIPVYIPCGTRDAYQNAMGWSNFTNYHEDCVTFEVYVEVVGEGTVNGAGTYNFGDICTLTATPNPGYVFDHWVHSTGELVEDNPYVFTVTSNVYVGAFFEAEVELPGDANGDGEMNALDIVIIVNYIFGETPDVFFFDNADVNGDGVVDVNDIVLIINLIFSSNTKTLTLTVAEGNGNVQINDGLSGPSVSQIINVGQSVTIHAYPSNGYNFVKWLDSGDATISTDANYTFNMPNYNYTLQAIFEQQTPPAQPTARLLTTNKVLVTGTNQFLPEIASIEDILAKRVENTDEWHSTVPEDLENSTTYTFGTTKNFGTDGTFGKTIVAIVPENWNLQIIDLQYNSNSNGFFGSEENGFRNDVVMDIFSSSDGLNYKVYARQNPGNGDYKVSSIRYVKQEK